MMRKEDRSSTRFAYLLILIFGIAVISRGQAPKPTPQSRTETLAAAKQAFDNGDRLLVRNSKFSLEAAQKEFQRASRLYGSLNDRGSEARAIFRIGLVFERRSQFQLAIDTYQKALGLQQAWLTLHSVEMKPDASETLRGLGRCYSSKGEYASALKYFARSAALKHELSNLAGEAEVHLRMAQILFDNFPNRHDEADSLFDRAFRGKVIHAGWASRNAVLMNNIGIALYNMGQYFEEIKNQQDISKRAGVLSSEQSLLTVLRHTSSHIESFDDAPLFFFYRALDIEKQTRNKRDLAQTFTAIGDCFNAKLLSGRMVTQPTRSVYLETFIGDDYLNDHAGLLRATIAIYEKAEELWQEVGDVSKQGYSLKTLGELAPNKEEANKYFEKAFLLSHQVENRPLEAQTLSHLMRNWSAVGNPGLAIAYGKQAVNLYQQLRSNIIDLNIETQRSFLQSISANYRLVADLLISQGRIPEAEQVLGMLKEEEYFDYLRREDKVARGLLKIASLTRDEADTVRRFDELSENITAIGKEYDLDFEESRQPEYEDKIFPKQARLDKLKKQLDAATTAFSKFLEDLKTTFKNDGRIKELESGLQAMLKSMNAKRSAIVSTIVTEDRLNIIVTTADTQHAHTVAIKAVDVNKLVAEFRSAVTDPKTDPRDSGKKLYDILVKPIGQDLAGIDADMIVWSLDGALRYAPVAALWDGQNYLAQRYANVIITLASQKNLEKDISDKTKWRALGVGVSKEYKNGQEEFPALGAVADELDCIINERATKALSLTPKCQRGVVDGKKLIDEKFTKAAFKNAMGRYSLVHIASHFSLRPGDDKNSFLLVGGVGINDRKLSVSEINQSLFNGVELLTLSACNTAVGTEKSNGVEVEGFGVVAQNQGARAVLASLWAVADPSTQELMTYFYRIYSTTPHITKAEALRLAQLSLLRGSYEENQPTPPTASDNNQKRAELAGKPQPGGASPQPRFQADPKAPYAHPYYWAPFILIGNWK